MINLFGFLKLYFCLFLWLTCSLKDFVDLNKCGVIGYLSDDLATHHHGNTLVSPRYGFGFIILDSAF